MVVKDVVMEDFVNYKKPSMFIIFPKCDFKCEKDCGEKLCQNSDIANLPDIEVSYEYVVQRYVENSITSSIVFGGLEPFDSPKEMIELVHELRKVTDDDIVIYTGYNKDEIVGYVNMLSCYKNIIVKFGRYIPNDTQHEDELLGINLASKNQYAERISLC